MIRSSGRGARGCFRVWVAILLAGQAFDPCFGWTAPCHGGRQLTRRNLLSDSFLEGDLVAVRIEPATSSEGGSDANRPRLCVVRPDGGVHALCTREGDVETDLFIDPRVDPTGQDGVVDGDIAGTYGEGWLGQRPVPSLGGGPGYGAEADDVWSTDDSVLEKLKEDGVELPVLDLASRMAKKLEGGPFRGEKVFKFFTI